MQSQTRGFNLIELMIGMTLGLFVIGGVISVFVATQQSNRTTQGLSQAQETQRIAFELLARSVREAGGNFCGKNLSFTTNNKVPNVLPVPIKFYLTNSPLLGVNDNVPPPPETFNFVRIPGTDAIRIFSASLGEPYSIVASGPFVPPAVQPASFTLNRDPVGGDFGAGSLAVACDYTQVSQFQVATNVGKIISYAANNPTFILPRNSAHSFMLAPDLIPAVLTPFVAEWWYVDSKTAPAVGRSLWRWRFPGPTQEILENVTDMQITYSRLGLPANQAFAPANPAWTQADWDSVIAVRINLTIETPIGVNERVDIAATPDINEHLTAQRTLTQTIIVRSRAE
jgi:type IV pilus assembly protein PilW